MRAQQHSCAQTRQLQGESPENLCRPGKRTQHSRKQGQSCQNPPGSGGLEGYRSLSCWLLDRSSRPVRDPDSISGRRKGQGGTAALRWVCPPARRPAELAAAPGLCPSTRPGQVHRCVPAPLPARRAQPPPWASALLLQGTVRAQPVSAGPSCQVFPSATAPFPEGCGSGSGSGEWWRGEGDSSGIGAHGQVRAAIGPAQVTGERNLQGSRPSSCSLTAAGRGQKCLHRKPQRISELTELLN